MSFLEVEFALEIPKYTIDKDLTDRKGIGLCKIATNTLKRVNKFAYLNQKLKEAH